jgi:hypothetical protein
VSRRRSGAALSLALGLCSLGLLAVALVEVEFVDIPGATVAQARERAEPAEKPLPPVPPFALPPLATLGEVLQRPLFSESRRPAPPAAQAPAQVNRELDGLALLGTMINANGRHALIQADGGTERLHEGEVWGGWTVEAIQPDRVVFSRGGEHDEVRVKEAAIAGK